jgi:hypothetical protein
MAEYINIRGQSIEVVASDPANPTLGQIWYNSTSNTLKGGGVTTAGAWATGNNMNTARSVFRRCRNSNCRFRFWWLYSSLTGATEEYDGNSWTNSNPLNTARRGDLAGAGIQTAGLAFGGVYWYSLYRCNRRI